jgi:hypothetical protein
MKRAFSDSTKTWGESFQPIWPLDTMVAKTGIGAKQSHHRIHRFHYSSRLLAQSEGPYSPVGRNHSKTPWLFFVAVTLWHRKLLAAERPAHFEDAEVIFDSFLSLDLGSGQK